MLKDPRQIIFEILEIIDYQKDKSEFARKFMELIMKKALLEILGELDPNKQKMIEEKVRCVKNYQNLIVEFKKYINPHMLERKIELQSGKQFEEYLQAIYPTLDKKIQQKLNDYLDSLPL